METLAKEWRKWVPINLIDSQKCFPELTEQQ